VQFAFAVEHSRHAVLQFGFAVEHSTHVVGQFAFAEEHFSFFLMMGNFKGAFNQACRQALVVSTPQPFSAPNRDR
jgi:hypothetical protein